MSKILNSVTLLIICTRGSRRLIPWRKSLCSLVLTLFFFLLKSQTIFLPTSALSLKADVVATPLNPLANPSVTITDGNGNDLPNASICPGSSITLYANAGGDEPISFSWTSMPTGFTSTDQGITVDPTTTTTYTIIVTDANGLTASDDITITVNPVPAIDLINDLSYCNGEVATAINFSGPINGTGFSWISSIDVGFGTNGNGNIGAFTASNNGITPITSTITVTPSANGCTGTPTTFTITVYPTVTVNSIADQTYCAGEIAPITNLSGPVSGTTFTWANNNTAIGLAASGSGDIPSFTATNATTSPITATITLTPSANGCTGTPTTFTITVYPTVTVNSIADQTYCAGEIAPITNLSGPVSGTTFTWTNSNIAIGLAASGSGDIPSFTATNATTFPISATITVTPSANGCTGTATTFTITVYPTATVNSISNQSNCAGAVAPITNLSGPVTGTTFTWTNSNTAIGLAANGVDNIPSFTATNATTSPITATITVTPSANGCTGTATTFNITVYPTATVNSTTNQTYCAGVIAPITNLSGPISGTTFTWTNSSTAIGLAASGSGNIPSFTATNATTSPTTATITVTPSANGCTGTATTFTITVYPTATVNSISNQSNCAGAVAPITNLSGPVTGTTFTWTNSNTAIGLAANGVDNIPSFTATNATTSPITATITVTPSANGCTGTATTFNITVYPTATVNSTTNQTYCAGVIAPITNLSGPISGTTFTWTNSSTAIGLAASGSGNIPSFTATNATTSPTTATVTVTPSANGCTGTPTTFTITVYPTATVNSTTNQTYCKGVIAPITNLSGPVGGTTFTWTNSNTAIGLAASGVGNIPSFTAANATTSPITATITVTPSANACTGTPSTFTITVYPTATVNSITNQTYCTGVIAPTTNLSGPVTGTTFTWTNSNTAIGLAASGSGNIPSFTATNATTSPTTATVTVTPSANGCTGTPTTFTITVYPTATVNSITNQTYCTGVIAPTTNLSGPVTGTTFTWTNSNTAIGLAANGSGNIPSFNATNATTSPISATITVTPSANGCIGTATAFTITVYPTATVNSISNQSNCAGAVAPITNLSGPVSGTTFTWTNSNTAIGLAASGSGNIPSFTATNATTSPITATIIVTPTANGCNGTVRTYTIIVNPTASVTSVASRTHCNGASGTAINFNGPVSGTSFSWTSSVNVGFGPSGTGNIPAYTANNAGTSPITATITVTPIANGCTGTPSTFNVTVNPTATVNSIANQTYCAGVAVTTTNLSGPVGGTTFTWTNNNTAIGLATNGSSDIPSFTAINGTTSPITATITITPSANGCNGTIRTYIITVNPTPAVGGIANRIHCNGASSAGINFTGPVAGSSFSWTSSVNVGFGTSGTGNIPAYTASNAGTSPITATITVTPIANGCTGTPSTFNVTVNPTATVNSIANQTYCAGVAVTATSLSGPISGTTFTWVNTNIAIGLAASGSGDIPSFTAINGTTSPITATITITPSANGCNGTIRTYIIIVNPTPTVGGIANRTHCNGTSSAGINFAGPVAGSGFSWTSSANVGFGTSGTGNIPAYTANNTGTSPVTATITVTPTANGCTGTPATFTVTVNPSTVVTTQPSNVTVCSGGNAFFSVGATGLGLTYQWQIGTSGSNYANISGATSSSYTISPVSASNANTYRVIVTGICGPVTSSIVTLTVNSIPSCAITGANVICSGSTTSFSASGGMTTYSWTGPGSFTAFTQSTGAISAAGAYVVNITDANGCQSSCARTLFVNPVPNPPAGTGNSRCGTGTVPISASAGVGETIDWYAVASGGTALATGTNSFTTPSLSITTTYYAEARNTTTGCLSSIRTPVTATINPLPTAPTSPVNGSRCGPGPVIISATSAAGTTIDWYSGATGGTVLAGGSGTTSFTTPGISVTTTYYAQTRNTTTGCISTNRTAVTAAINAIPATATSPVNGSRCGPGSVTISATSLAGTTIDWYTASTGGTLVGTGSSFTTPTISATTTYYAGVRNITTGCTSVIRVAVIATVNTPPTISVPTPAAFCGGGSVSLTASGATTYSWSPSTGLSSTTGATVVAGPSTTTTYSVTGTDGNGCSNTTTVMVTVIPSPNGGSISPQVTTACANSNNGTLTLSGNAGSVVRWESSTDGAATWTQISNISNTLIYSNLSQTTLYRAYISDGTCTSYSANAVVSVIPAIAPTGAIASPSQICLGDSSTLSAGASGYPTSFAGVEDFNNASLDNSEGWRSTENGAPHNIEASADNQLNTPWNLTNPKTFNDVLYDSGDPKFAIAAGANNTTMETPVFSTIGMSTASLSFWQAFNLNAGTSVKVEISTDGGSTYQLVPLFQATGPASLGVPNGGFVNTTLDLTNYLGLSNLRVRFNYSGSNGSNWGIDNFGIPGPQPPLTYAWKLIDPSGVTYPYYLNDTTMATVKAGPPAPGTYTYQVNTTYGGCPGGSQNVIVVVNPLPTATISGNPNVCSGQTAGLTITLTGTAPWSVTYTNGTTNFSINNISSPYVLTLSPVATTTYSLVSVSDANCSNSAAGSATVTVNPLPVVFTVNSCIGGGAVTFSQTGGATGGTWTVSGGGTITSAGVFNPTTPGCFTATYTTPSPFCPDNENFVVFPVPVLTAPANTCGSAFTLPAVTPVAGFTIEYSIDGNTTWSASPTIPTTPGCHTIQARYVRTATCGSTAAGTPSSCLSNVVSVVIFPAAPLLAAPANTCASAFTLPTVTAVAGFNVEFSVDGGTYSSSPTIPTVPGCHTIQARYVLGAACGNTTAAAAGPCLSNIVSVVVFPAAPVISAPSNTCASTFTLPTVTAVTGFTVQYSIDGGSYSASPTIITPGCHTIQAQYVLTSNCGATTAGTTGIDPCGTSNIVSALIFPAAPNAPVVTPGCDAFTVTPPPPVSGFNIEYSFDDGVTWGANTPPTAENCTGYKIKTRYVTAADCGSTLAGTPGSGACGESPVTTRKVDNTKPDVICPIVSPVCQVTGDVYTIPSLIASDNCSPSASLTVTYTISGATTRSGSGVDASGIFNAGISTITWTVTDECGNSNTCTTQVTIYPKPAPIIYHN